MEKWKKNALFEEYMPLADELAEGCDDGTLPLEDLKQEAYLGLMNGIARMDAEDTEFDAVVARSADEIMREAIEAQLSEAVAAEKGARSEDEELVKKVELADKAIKHLTEELGSAPTVDELANELGVTQEEALAVLRLAGGLPEDKEEGFAIDNPALDAFLPK